MKKVILIIIAFITIVVSANAQSLIEVRGVETKKSHEFIKKISKDNSSHYVIFDEGFLFTNQNSFSVSVEATLFDGGEEKDAKSFELAPKESYFWCTQPKVSEYRWNNSTYDCEPCARGYVKYKAFRSNAVPK